MNDSLPVIFESQIQMLEGQLRSTRNVLDKVANPTVDFLRELYLKLPQDQQEKFLESVTQREESHA